MKTFSTWLTEMIHLHDVFAKKEGAEFVADLLNKSVVVSVKVDSSAFVVENAHGTLKFYSRNGAQEIDDIKRSILSIYEDAIAHIERMPWKKLPPGIKFYFEMFNDVLNPIIKYRERPRNNLILLFGEHNGHKLRPDDHALTHAAEILECSPPPIIFKGRLPEISKSKIMSFITTPAEDRKHIFGLDNFRDFVLGMFLAPAQVKWLIQDGLEGLVFFFGDNDAPVSFKIVDPAFTDRIKGKMVDSKEFPQALGKIVWGKALDMAQVSLQKMEVNQGPKQRAYINFIASLTEALVKAENRKLLNTLESYKSKVTSSRYAALGAEFLPASMIDLNKKFWFTEDIYRMLASNLQRPKTRIDNGQSITSEVKEKINAIYALLSSKGLV